MDESFIEKVAKWTDIEIEFKSEQFIVNNKLIDTDEYIDLYNRIPEDRLKLIIKTVGIHRLTDKIIKNLNSMDIIIEYFKNNYYSDILDDSIKGKKILETSEFYSGKKAYNIVDYYKQMNNSDNKLLMIQNFIKFYQKYDMDQVIRLYSGSYFEEFDDNTKDYLNSYSNNIIKNIMNSNTFEKDFIRYYFLKSGYISLEDRYIDIYNSMTIEEFKKLLSICGINYIKYELFTKIEDKEKVLLPFSKNLIDYNLFEHEDFLKLYIDSKTFYDGITKDYYIGYVYNAINDESIKNIFISNFLKYSDNKYLILEVDNPEIQKYITDDLIFEIVSPLINKVEHEEELSNQEHYVLNLIFKKSYSGLKDTQQHLNLYKNISRDTFRKILTMLDIYTFSDEIINNIDDMEKIIFPNSYKNVELLNNEKYVKAAIKSKYFLVEPLRLFDIELMIDKFPNEELKFEFVKYLFDAYHDFVFKEILSSPNTLNPNNNVISNYITDEMLVNEIKNNLPANYLRGIFKKLSDDTKRELYRSEWFRNQYDLNNKILKNDLLESLPDDIIIEEVSSSFDLLNLYRETHRFIFLKELVNKAEDDIFCGKDFFHFIQFILNIPDEYINNLGDSKKRFFELIDNMSNDNIVAFFFECYNGDYHCISKDYIFDRVCNILQNTDLKIEKLSRTVLNTKDEKILELIINNITKSDLLLLSIRHPYFNEKVLNLLNENPNYFDGVQIEDISKYTFLKINEENIQKYFSIAKYLKEEQLKIFYSTEYLRNNEKLKNKYINDIKNDYNIITSLDSLEFFSEDEVKNIIDNIPIRKFMNLVYYKSFNPQFVKTLRPYMKSRVFDVANFLSDQKMIYEILEPGKDKKTIFYLFNDEDIVTIVNNMEDISFLSHILLTATGPLRTLLKERLSYLIEMKAEFSLFSNFPHFYEEKEREAFFESISFQAFLAGIIHDLTFFPKNDQNSIEYCNYIRKKINENFDIIYNIAFSEKLNLLLNRLPDDISESIIKDIDTKFELYKNKYPKLLEYINSYGEKANFVGALQNNLINDDNIELVYQLLESNKYLFNSMDFRLLKPDLLKMGGYFLNKTSRYPVVAIKTNKIYEQDKNKYELLVKLSNIIRQEKNDSVYDIKIENIINYILLNDIKINSEVDDNLIYNLENYILDACFIKEYNFKTLGIDNYNEEKKKYIDKKIEQTDNYKKLIDLIYLKHFGVTKEMIDNFIVGYTTNWDSVSSLCDSNLPNEYISLINKINGITDIATLKEITNNLACFTLSDYLNVTGIMISTYNKAIIEDSKETNKGVSKELIIDGKKIEVEDITNSFNIVVHSTDAYGSMPLINDNYYDSWNNNPNTRNHGICCSYISNTSYGTAAVKSKGIMLGFKIEDENDVPLFAPYDLATINTGYNITSVHNPYFARLSTISDTTRHTHNEFTIERRNGKTSDLRQPNYIIIFEDMSDEVKQNSIKAYEDFRANGINIELKYIDRVQNCKLEANIIDNMIKSYELNPNLDVLAQIINKYESNICGCNFIGTGKNSLNLFNQYELFNTKKIKELIYGTIISIKNIEDINDRNNKIKYFLSIIEHEQRKFTLIEDLCKKRARNFDLLDEKIEEEINLLKGLLNEEIKEEKKYK